MTPSQQQRKDRQDEARREQQADEKIHELEEEVERLREALIMISGLSPNTEFGHETLIRAQEALDGKGGDDD